MSWCYRQLYFDLCFADDVLGDEEDEEESDAVVTQVLDELGLQLTDNLAGVDVPTGSISVGHLSAESWRTTLPKHVVGDK